MKALIHFCVLLRLTTTAVSWVNHLKLDSEGYQVWWSFVGEDIKFRIEVAGGPTWVAFGVSPTGEIQDGDFLTVWLINGGGLVFQDCHGNDSGVLLKDDQQDWKLLRQTRNVSYTVIEFQRKLDTCDKDDVPFTDDTMRLMYAYDFSMTAPGFHEPIMYQRASHRGKRSILLLQPQSKPIREDYLHWDVKSPNVRLRNGTTPAYFCSVHMAPDLGRKHHIIGYGAVLQPGHELFVHHIILSACVGVTDNEMAPYVNTSISCIGEDALWKMDKCRTAIATWSLHKQETIFPDHIGVPFGQSHPTYFVLDVHYHNIPKNTEYFDNSGLRVKYTRNLRKHDGALLLVGTEMHPCVIVPPKQKEFKIVGHASSECLSPALPPAGITVYSVKLHAHLTGRKLALRHFRNGIELPPLAKDDNFDFYYQEDKIVKGESKVLPGDHLSMECVYDTTSRNFTTLGGLQSTDEMCLAYIFYYPIIARSNILSSPSCSLVAGLTGASVTSEMPQWIISPVTGQNQSFDNYIATYRWNPKQTPFIQGVTLYCPHFLVCTSDNGTIIQPPRTASYPEINQTYKPSSKCSGA